MIVDSNGKILECTEEELYDIWLSHWCDIIDFKTYKLKCVERGTIVILKEYKEDKQNGK